jgi:sporulation integral membrane protein YtvI
MTKKLINRIYLTAGVLLGGWLFLCYGLPVLLPFLLGAALALAAEPLVGLLDRRLRLPRFAAAGIGVTAVFVLLIALLVMLIALVIREAGRLSGIMPDLVESVRQGLGSLEQWLLGMSEKAPEGVQSVLKGSVVRLFSGSDATMDRFADRLLGVAAEVLSWVTSGALTFATAVLAAFMISSKLPRIRIWIRDRIPAVWRERYLPAVKGMKNTLFGWLTAQLKLSAMTLVVLLVGFWVLQIPHKVVWAVGVALVDAIPVLGTGTVLLPWSLVCLLQGQTARGAGLLGVFAVVWLVRSVLEPRLLGKELGLDPLVTLLAMYAGFKLLGVAGMILSPLLAVAVVRLMRLTEGEQNEKGAT